MFYWLLLSISVVPYAIFPAVFAGKAPPNTETVRQAILFLANAHIAITLFFYWDTGFRAIRTANPFRYAWLPAAAVVLGGLSYALISPPYEIAWWVGYAAWQNWHFGKQTFGLYALVNADQSPDRRVSSMERWIIHVAVLLGTFGGIWVVTAGSGGEVDAYAHIIRRFCGYGTLALVALALGYAWTRAMNAKQAVFFLLSVAFFAPQYIASTIDLGFVPYSVAHSLQYLFIMSIVAFNIRHPAREDGFDGGLITAIVFFAILLVGGAVVTIRGEFGGLMTGLFGWPWLGRFVTGAMFGLVMAHFVVDAHAWRLREKPQREFVFGRMRFLGKTGARLAPVEVGV